MATQREAQTGFGTETGQTRAFDAHTALKTPGFLEFVSRFPDSDEIVKDDAELERKFVLFEKKGVLAKEIKTLLQERISKDLEVSIPTTDLAGIDAYIERSIAQEDTWAIERLEKALKQYRELPKKLEEQRKALQEMGNKQELLKKKEAMQEQHQQRIEKITDLEGEIDKAGFFKRKWKNNKKGSLIADDQKEGKKYKALRNQLEKIDDAEQAKAQLEYSFTDSKYALFTEVDEVKEIFELARKKAAEKLNSFFDPNKDVSSFAKGLAYFNKIDTAEQDPTSAIDYLAEGLEDETGITQSREELRETITDRLVDKVTQEIGKYLSNTATHNVLSGYPAIINKLRAPLGENFDSEKFKEIETLALQTAISRAPDLAKRLILVRLKSELDKTA